MLRQALLAFRKFAYAFIVVNSVILLYSCMSNYCNKLTNDIRYANHVSRSIVGANKGSVLSPYLLTSTYL